MINDIFSSTGKINRFQYLIGLIVLISIPFIVSAFALSFFSEWHHGTHFPLGIFVSLIFSMIAYFGVLMHSIKRLNHLGSPPALSIILILPFLNLIFIAALLLLPGKK